MSISLRKYQQEAYDAIYAEDGDCLVKMFCGTGKTRIMLQCALKGYYNLTVLVFPSISLITQFNTDYLHNPDWEEQLNDYRFLTICSKDELRKNTQDIQYTTTITEIVKFLKSGFRSSKPDLKMVCVTYQSFQTFVKALHRANSTIDLIMYDEAHHIVAETVQEIIFNDKEFSDRCLKSVYFTATPRNDNGIIMLERDYSDISYDLDGDEEEYSIITDCNRLAFEYTHFVAVKDGICNDFDIIADFYSGNDEGHKSYYRSIARAVFNTGNTRVLTLHSFSEAECDNRSNVINFCSKVNQKVFQEEFHNVLETEFLDLIEKYKGKLIVKGITAKTRNKPAILEWFDKIDDNVKIVASCNTLGEGIDTKNANMVVFIDPRASKITIQQNIGRVCRKQERHSTVLLPCYVDADLYSECETKEDRDRVIRESFGKKGDFNSILNVLSAMREEDPYMVDLCMNYPNSFAPKEVKKSLAKQGYSIQSNIGDVNETINSLIDEPNEDLECTDDMEDKAALIGKTIVVHSTSMDEPIKIYGDYDKSIVLYNDPDKDEWRPVKKNGKKSAKKISAPSRRKINVNVHTDKDVKVLWAITDDIGLGELVRQAYIEATIVEDNWSENLEKLDKFLETEGRRPKRNSENLEERRLSVWGQGQEYCYKKNLYCMKNPIYRQNWETFRAKWSEYFLSKDEKWLIKLNNIITFIKNKNKRPNNVSTDLEEKKLGQWYSSQQQKYKNNTMQLERIPKWENFIQQWNYIISQDEVWLNNLCELDKFIEKTHKKPSNKSLNVQEKSLGAWCGTQMDTYKNNTMQNDKIIKWEQFIQKWSEYFLSKDEEWLIKLNQLDLFFSKENRKPHTDSITEKNLNKWCNRQIEYYRKNKMKKQRQINWEKFITKWAKILTCYDDIWINNLNKLDNFFETEGRKPKHNSENLEEKLLSTWLNNQVSVYKKLDRGMKNPCRRKMWEKFIDKWKEYFLSKDELWLKNLNDLETFIKNKNKRPVKESCDIFEKKLGNWIGTQIKDYKNNKCGMKKPDRRKAWEEFARKNSKYLGDISYLDDNEEEKPNQKSMKYKPKAPSKGTGQRPPQTILNDLHKKYKSMRSDTLHKHFEESPEDWHKYHEIAEANEQTFPDDQIPYKCIIDYIKPKSPCKIVDMGCGKARVSKYFEGSNHTFYNFDHIAVDETVNQCDIKNLPLEDNSVDIAILCLAMWGVNSKDYLREAHRVLKNDEKLLLIEGTQKWIEDDGTNKLEKWLEEAGFKIIRKEVEKFSFYVCFKV